MGSATAARLDEAEHTQDGPRRFDRRSFLRTAGIGGAGLALVASLPTIASASTRPQIVVVYRLSSRGRHACNACKAHDAHTYFRKARMANRLRAHHGCSCRITTQKITRQLWLRYFPKGPNNGRPWMYDDRVGR